MAFRQFFILFSVLICVSAKSFTIVIDTTLSMSSEINIIRRRIGPMINSIANSSEIDNFIIVPFKDPDVGPVLVYTTTDPFINYFNYLRVSGGGEIPENSLSGLEKALLESKPESDIFLFTDACAKDEAKFYEIQRLCRVTRSKIIVFMSGKCSFSETNEFGNMETYYHVTKVCFGNVVQLDFYNYESAFGFMKEIAENNYNDVKAFEPFTGSNPLQYFGDNALLWYHRADMKMEPEVVHRNSVIKKRNPVEFGVFRIVSFSAESLTREVIVAVAGRLPSLQLFEENGHSPRTETLIKTNDSQVVRIVRPHRGSYEAIVRCVGLTYVTIYKKNEFPLEMGFSPFTPANIMATSLEPLPGQTSFIYVLVPKSYTYKLNSLTIYNLKEENYKSLGLVESGVNARVYIAQDYFQPGSKFQVTVNGIDTRSSESVKMISKTFETQTEATNVPWSSAVIQSIIPESPLIDYKKSARVACRVAGCPQPSIWWEDENGQRIESQDSLLEYPATYISYIEIPNMTKNTTVTCKAETATGNDVQSIELNVYRPYVFDMIRSPEDTTIPYEEEGKIYCEVNAYPDPTITWYHNDKEIHFANEVDHYDNDLDFTKEDNALVIKNMTSKYTGTYKCDVRNDANYKSFSAEIRISGLEIPMLQTSDTEITSKLDDSVTITCRLLKGKPNPTVTWKFKAVNDYDFSDLSDDIDVGGETLTINRVLSKHKGIYKCEAVNEQGQDSREIKLKVIYAPRIKNDETVTMEVLKEQWAKLDCMVDAEPEATVRWERLDGTGLPEGAQTARHSLTFMARYSDSGEYQCIAENEAGTATKTVNVNVLARPYITPVEQTVTVKAGNSLTLRCNVEEGNPPPSLEWTFTSLDSRSESNKSMLVFPRVTKAHSGTYVCFVQNKVGQDTIEIVVNVTS